MLLNTIKLPKNLKLLSDRLPKSKYDEESNSVVNDSKSLLNEVSSMKSLKTNPEESAPTGGKRAHPKRSAMSEDRKLKRNASENLQNAPLKHQAELVVGGERLRDKNSHDYLETIRENEGLHNKKKV